MKLRARSFAFPAVAALGLAATRCGLEINASPVIVYTDGAPPTPFDAALTILPDGNIINMQDASSLDVAVTPTDAGGDTATFVDAADASMIPDERRVVQVVVGEEHACAIMADGKLRCWGSNVHGELGRDSTGAIGRDEKDVIQPAGIPDGERVTQAALGYRYTCALTIDSTNKKRVRCFGLGVYGQLGNGATSDVGKAAKSIADSEVVLRTDSSVEGDSGADASADAGADTAEPLSVHAGSFAACARYRVGQGVKLYCWGYNSEGELGVDSSELQRNAPKDPVAIPGDPSSVSLGVRYGCATFRAGGNDELRCWGKSNEGQAGPDDNRGRPPKLVNDAPVLSPTLAVPDVVQVVTGSQTTCVRSADGQVRCFGDGNFGSTGRGSKESIGKNSTDFTDIAKVKPVNLDFEKAGMISAGYTHACILTPDGRVRCWGYGAFGALGAENYDNLMDDARELPSNVNLGRTAAGALRATAIALGGQFSCALLENNQVKCWGRNEFGQLGQGRSNPSIGNVSGEMGSNLPAVRLFP
jgi:alpha-tubulin suppressor-like RCC1 family protein